MKSLFITGEASGDLHAFNLIRSLKHINPEIQFIGIGGEKMTEVGVRIIYPAKAISVIGFSEVIGKIPYIREARQEVSRIVKKERIDFAVTIDFPGFNIPVAKHLYNNGIPVFYFITPQVWAWGGWRIRQLQKYFKHLFVILPFEEKFFAYKSINASFLGNPLLDIAIAPGELKRSDLPDAEPLVSLLPGSRESEIKRIFAPMLGAYRLFQKKYPKSAAVVALHNEKLLPLAKNVGGNLLENIPIFCGKTYDILHLCNIAVVTSGTATIEAGIFNTPMVIVYKLSFLSWIIARLLARVEHFGLINLIFSKEVVPELIQREVTPKNICSSLEKVYMNREEISKNFGELKQKLGSKGCYDRLAHSLLSMV